MAAGPVGSVWVSGSWSDTCWEANTWATAVAVLTPYDELTDALVYRLEALRAASALTDLDNSTLLAADIETARGAEAQVDDLNTTLWLYLTQ